MFNVLQSRSNPQGHLFKTTLPLKRGVQSTVVLLFAQILVLFSVTKRGHKCLRMAISRRFGFIQFVKEWVNYISGLLAWCVPSCLRTTDPVKKDMADVRNQNRMNGPNRTKNFLSLVRKLKPSFTNRKRSKVDSFSPILTQSIFIDKDGVGIEFLCILSNNGFYSFILHPTDVVNFFEVLCHTFCASTTSRRNSISVFHWEGKRPFWNIPLFFPPISWNAELKWVTVETGARQLSQFVRDSDGQFSSYRHMRLFVLFTCSVHRPLFRSLRTQFITITFLGTLFKCTYSYYSLFSFWNRLRNWLIHYLQRWHK